MLQWVASIDIAANEEADVNVLAKICDSFCEHAEQVSIKMRMRNLDRWKKKNRVHKRYRFILGREKEVVNMD